MLIEPLFVPVQDATALTVANKAKFVTVCVPRFLVQLTTAASRICTVNVPAPNPLKKPELCQLPLFILY